MNSTRYNRILLIAFVLVLVVTVVRGYYYTYVHPSFPVLTYVSCDPSVDTCFEYEGEYYAYATMDAEEYAVCSEEGTCDEVCATSETCEIEYCSEEALSEGESCSVPGEMLEEELEDMPIEEESSATEGEEELELLENE